MAKLDLKLHPMKTKIVSMWDGKEGFDFLGMHHRRMTTETRKGHVGAERIKFLQVVEELGRNIPEVDFSINLDDGTGLFR